MKKSLPKGQILKDKNGRASLSRGKKESRRE
jgi:hypothetical protein